jgi:hypothetical protein
MSSTRMNEPKEPVQGSRCVAGPGGHWAPATILRINEDGTYKIEFDVKQMTVMPHWLGVTRAEISFDEARMWARVFAQLSPDGKTLVRASFSKALDRLGFKVATEKLDQFWDAGCKKLFDVSDTNASSLVLDSDSSYRLFLHLGVAAKECAELLESAVAPKYFKLYWNQQRMGGREPTEVKRPVSLNDAFAALGLVDADLDESAVDFLQGLEREHSVRLPAALKALFFRVGAAEAIAECHPNNPSPLPFEKGNWTIRRGMRERQLNGDFALVIMTPHQGDHEWAVVFDNGEEDARVYVRWDTEDGESWLLTAPSIGMFFWDLAQTGLVWYEDTRFRGGKPVKRSDIGLVLDS